MSYHAVILKVGNNYNNDDNNAMFFVLNKSMYSYNCSSPRPRIKRKGFKSYIEKTKNNYTMSVNDSWLNLESGFSPHPPPNVCRTINTFIFLVICCLIMEVWAFRGGCESEGVPSFLTFFKAVDRGCFLHKRASRTPINSFSPWGIDINCIP